MKKLGLGFALVGAIAASVILMQGAAAETRNLAEALTMGQIQKFSKRPIILAACEVTSCQNTCTQIRSNCYNRGGALVNCEAQYNRCNLNCINGCN
jgi:hypothetical protein